MVAQEFWLLKQPKHGSPGASSGFVRNVFPNRPGMGSSGPMGHPMVRHVSHGSLRHLLFQATC